MTELKQMLKALTEAEGLGGLTNALDEAEKFLSKYTDVQRSKNNLLATFRGKNDYTILLDAHIDEIGMVVTFVKNGFVKVASVGGIDSRMLSAMRVKIHGKQTVRGVFCSVPPHLSKADSVLKIDEMYIDTGLGGKAEDLISVGDRVTFEQSFKELEGDLVTSKSLDNRAGCASLIRCAELLSGKELPCNVVILLSDMEEIGGMGAKTESFAISPDEAVVVDVSFGNAPNVEPEKTGTLGDGAMLGISPVLSKTVTDCLQAAALSNDVKYQFEVMGGKTSTNADNVAFNKCGVPTALLSIPLRNMHTPVEIIDVNDVESVARILAGYVLSKKF